MIESPDNVSQGRSLIRGRSCTLDNPKCLGLPDIAHFTEDAINSACDGGHVYSGDEKISAALPLGFYSTSDWLWWRRTVIFIVDKGLSSQDPGPGAFAPRKSFWGGFLGAFWRFAIGSREAAKLDLEALKRSCSCIIRQNKWSFYCCCPARQFCCE